LARNKPLFKLNWTRNNSDALLLTMFDFTMRRGDERFTKRRAESAVQDDNPPARLAKPALGRKQSRRSPYENYASPA
jgi:hypothetical protein